MQSACLGLLTDAAGFSLMVEACEGNAAETSTMLPTITAFVAAHQLADVTVAADAGVHPAQLSPGRSGPSAPRT